MIGMLMLVFFPFFYGIALSFTNANIYNTNKTIFETWVGLQNYLDIISDFHIVHRTATGGRLGLPEFLLHAAVHHRLDGDQRGDRRHPRARPGADPEPEGLRPAPALPGAADPALGDAQLHHGADLQGHVPPAVRRDQSDPPDRSAAPRSPGSTTRSPRSWRC